MDAPTNTNNNEGSGRSKQSTLDEHEDDLKVVSVEPGDVSGIAVPAARATYRSARWFSYLVLAMAATNVIFLGGKRRAFGIFVADLHHKEFNTTSLAELNWIGDSYAALGYMSTTFTTAAILRFKRRYRVSQLLGALLILLACITSAKVPSAHWLFLTHTVLHGLGSSLVLSTVGLIVNDYFPASHPRHLLATTLVSGGSVASIVFVELYAGLISAYGWRHTFIILGVVYFFVNSSACFVFVNRVAVSPRSRSGSAQFIGSTGSCGNNESPTTATKGFPVICGSRCQPRQVALLVLWMLDRVMTSIVTYGMLLNLADYLHRTNPSLTGSTMLTVLFASGEAVTYLVGTVVTGLTRRALHNRLKYILLCSTLLMALSLLAWEVVAENLHLSRLLAFVSGLCLGPSITFLFPAGEEMTGLPGHMAYPFSLFGMGLGMATSPLLTAYMATIFDYKWFFLTQGLLIGFKFLCLCASCLILAYDQRLQKQNHPIGANPLRRGVVVGHAGGSSSVGIKVTTSQGGLLSDKMRLLDDVDDDASNSSQDNGNSHRYGLPGNGGGNAILASAKQPYRNQNEDEEECEEDTSLSVLDGSRRNY